MLKTIFLFVIGLLIVSSFYSTNINCADPWCNEYSWGYPTAAFNQYKIGPTLITPNGTIYDPSGLNISPDLIDRLTNEVDDCLSKNNDYPHIDRGSFIVKIANDWSLNCDGTQQLLQLYADSAGCAAKGLSPTEQCPCKYRAVIACSEDHSYPVKLIVTPSLYLYKDVLVRFITGSNNPWANEQLSICVTPSTTPLGDGTDPKNGLQ